MLGTRIGNYQVTSLIAEGGMGKVYLAEHPGLGRHSAIKVLHPNLASDPEVVSRFFTEARAANAIRHPNIVEIHDYGTLPDGAPYLVMEYLEGETLSSRIARAPMPLGETLDFACQTASALVAAHAQQIVHRDLKPDNLFLIADERAPGKLQVKILDFGIAKLQRDRPGGQSHRTRTGVLMGTPIYMSPEQCLGVKEVDARSDVYSLGVIVFEMMCGRPPFESEGVGALINMHVNDPPPAPRSINPALPARLEQAVLRALAKLPEQRFATMAELHAELQAVLAAVARPSSALADVMPPMRPAANAVTAVPTTLSAGARHSAATEPGAARRRWLVGAGAALVVGAVVIAVRRSPTPVPPAPTAAPGPAPAPALAAAPAAPVATAPPPPSAVEIPLDSEPQGATVTAGGVIVGVTPTTFRARPADQPIEFAFTLDGYRRESVQAIAAPGLKLRMKLRKLAHAPAARPRSSTPKPPSPNDIKSER